MSKFVSSIFPTEFAVPFLKFYLEPDFACAQSMNKCQILWSLGGQKRQVEESTFIILCNKLLQGS